MPQDEAVSRYLGRVSPQPTRRSETPASAAITRLCSDRRGLLCPHGSRFDGTAWNSRARGGTSRERHLAPEGDQAEGARTEEERRRHARKLLEACAQGTVVTLRRAIKTAVEANLNTSEYIKAVGVLQQEEEKMQDPRGYEVPVSGPVISLPAETRDEDLQNLRAENERMAAELAAAKQEIEELRVLLEKKQDMAAKPAAAEQEERGEMLRNIYYGEKGSRGLPVYRDIVTANDGGTLDEEDARRKLKGHLTLETA